MENAAEVLSEVFVPDICKPKGDVPAAYEGTVKIRVPDYDERVQFMLIPEVLDAVDAAKDGSNPADVSDALMNSMKSKQNLAIMANVKKQLSQWVLEINIKRLDDGFVFTTLNQVRYDSDVGSVMQEIALRLLGKYRWGNAIAPST